MEQAQLSEPSGIVEAENGKLLIADTNNSVIRYLNLNKEKMELLTLELKGVQPPAAKLRSLKRLRQRSSADTKTITVKGDSSNSGNLLINISVPEGFHFSKVYYCKEDEVCPYQSLAFEVPFQKEAPSSTPANIILAYVVKPKTTSSLQLSVAR